MIALNIVTVVVSGTIYVAVIRKLSRKPQSNDEHSGTYVAVGAYDTAAVELGPGSK